MARLELLFLGSFQARLEGRRATELQAERVRALLAYLAVEADRERARSSLAALLWPDCDESVALSNLRFTLSDLRHGLGDTPAPPEVPTLLVTRETIRLNPECDCFVDALEFRRLCATQESPGSRDLRRSLESAVRLYGGPFLEGFSLQGSTAYEDWLMWTRDQFQQMMSNALRRLVSLYVEEGRHGDAQTAARRQVQLEPLDEEAHRQLMAVLAGSGQRIAALNQFEICRRILAQEFGLEPMPETVALAEAIRGGGFVRAGDRSIVAGGIPQRTREAQPSDSATSVPVFVARERELAQMDRHLSEVLAGRGRVVFVSGDAGSGKTALLREFVERALRAHSDLTAASGSCNAATGPGDPYLPFREILQLLAGDIEARRAGGAISALQAQRLWNVLPRTVEALIEEGSGLVDLFVPGVELLLHADSATLGVAAGADWRSRLTSLIQKGATSTLQQNHIGEQVMRVLRAIARRSPLILVLDDLQWVDDASTNLLLYLGHHLGGSRILIAGAYRSPDIDLARNGERHPLATVIHEFQRNFGDNTIDLEQAEGRAFLDAIFDREPNLLGEDFRSTFHRHTGGHALFTVELLRELQTKGVLVRDGEGRWTEDAALSWHELPPRVEAVIAERIDRLPREMQTLLEVATVEGEEFTAEVVAQVLGLDCSQVLRQLSSVLGKQHRLVRGHSMIWLEPDRRSVSRFRFLHVLFHDYLYQRLDPVEKARLHRMTGEALEGLYGTQSGSIAVQLAHHYERAGLAVKAVTNLETAADMAMRLGAYREATDDIKRGLALVATLPETPERDRIELRLRTVMTGLLGPLHGMGDDTRINAATPALTLGLDVGGIQAIYALYLQAEVLRARADYAAALEIGNQILAYADASGSRQAAMLARSSQGTTRFFAGHVTSARTDLERAVSLYRRDEDDALESLVGMNPQVMTLAFLATNLWMLGFAEQAAAKANDAVELAKVIRQPYTSTLVLAVLILPAIYGAIDYDVEAAIHALAQLIDEHEIDAFRPWARFYAGWLLVGQGRTAEGVEQMHRNLPGHVSGGTNLGAAALRVILAQACLEAKMYDEGLRTVKEAMLLRSRGIGAAFGAEIDRLHGALVLGQAEQGNVEIAEASFLRAVRTAHEQAALTWELRAATDLARLRQRTGRDEEAHTSLAAVYNQFREGFSTPDVREAAAALEELSRAALRGDD